MIPRGTENIFATTIRDKHSTHQSRTYLSVHSACIVGGERTVIITTRHENLPDTTPSASPQTKHSVTPRRRGTHPNRNPNCEYLRNCVPRTGSLPYRNADEPVAANPAEEDLVPLRFAGFVASRHERQPVEIVNAKGVEWGD